MKASKNRQDEKSRRRRRRVLKQELSERIQKLRESIIINLEQRLVLMVVVEEALKSKQRAKSLTKQPHRKLSLQERQELYLCRSLGFGVREIARRLFRAPSTISRELKRNKPFGRLHGLCSYSRAKQAHDLASERRRKSRRRIRFGSVRTQGIVYEAISKGMSPDLASGRLFIEHGIRLSHEAIYRWIYDVERTLIECLYRKGKSYRRGGKKRSRVKPQTQTAKLSIEKRPEAANERLEFGHWEVDCIVSKQSNTCLLVLQERVSRFFFVEKLANCTAKEASSAIIRLLEPFGRDWLKSLTCDNGAEFWSYEAVSLALEIPVYFCHPYCSSERGGVENRNGMLRKFFPKKTDFAVVTEQELEAVYQTLLNRPMRCLEYFTPKEILTGEFEPLLKRAA